MVIVSAITDIEHLVYRIFCSQTFQFQLARYDSTDFGNDGSHCRHRLHRNTKRWKGKPHTRSVFVVHRIHRDLWPVYVCCLPIGRLRYIVMLDLVAQVSPSPAY